MKLLSTLLLISGLLLASQVQAALVGFRLLNFEGAAVDPLQNNIRPADGTGSWFNVSPFAGEYIYTSLTSWNGLEINGGSQPASGAHMGSPDGSENPGIDQPWEFVTSTGMHMTTSPVTVLSQSGNTVLLDFSGWTAIWGSQTIFLGAGSWGSNPDGVAILTCAIDCSNIGTVEGGEAWSLSYTATVQDGALLGMTYELHLESAVPIPAALYLFIPGLLSLFAVSRRKTKVI